MTITEQGPKLRLILSAFLVAGICVAAAPAPVATPAAKTPPSSDKGAAKPSDSKPAEAKKTPSNDLFGATK